MAKLFKKQVTKFQVIFGKSEQNKLKTTYIHHFTQLASLKWQVGQWDLCGFKQC